MATDYTQPTASLYYRASEAARVLGVTGETVRRWAASGKLQVVRIGGTLLIPRCQAIFHPERLVDAERNDIRLNTLRITRIEELHRQLQKSGHRTHLVDKIA